MTDAPYEFNALPDGLLDCAAADLARHLPGPSLIHLPGTRQPALFVSVLLHGNEPVGWEALRQLLRARIERHGDLHLPRALSIFIGNVAAAASGARSLPGQPDYNRVWPGAEDNDTPEHGVMQRVADAMARRGLFASIDLHNNTGANPHYACVSALDHHSLHLATLFSRTVVYFLRPRGVQSQAMASLCPAVTLECGKVGDALGVEHAADYLDACLHLAELPDHQVPAHDIDLFHSVARVCVPAGLAFGFAPAAAPLVFTPELERLNFRELAAGTALARVQPGLQPTDLLEVQDEQGKDVTARWFCVEDGELRLRLAAMPSMLTRDEAVIRQDCLCYLLKRYDQHLPRRD